MTDGRSSSRARSRQRDAAVDGVRPRPLYARLLGLKHIRPSGVLCFLFFEGSVALAVLLALAELVDWLAVLVLPLSIALMVKINDIIAGAASRSRSEPVAAPPRGRAVVVSARVATDYHNPAEPADEWAQTQSGYEYEDDADETPWLGRQRSEQRNEIPDGGDAAQRARQSAAYRYE